MMKFDRRLFLILGALAAGGSAWAVLGTRTNAEPVIRKASDVEARSCANAGFDAVSAAKILHWRMIDGSAASTADAERRPQSFALVDVFGDADPLYLSLPLEHRLVWRSGGDTAYVTRTDRTGLYVYDVVQDGFRRFSNPSSWAGSFRPCSERTEVIWPAILREDVLPVCLLDDEGRVHLAREAGSIFQTGESLPEHFGKGLKSRAYIDTRGRVLGFLEERTGEGIIARSTTGESISLPNSRLDDLSSWTQDSSGEPLLVTDGQGGENDAIKVLKPEAGSWTREAGIRRSEVWSSLAYAYDGDGRRYFDGIRTHYEGEGAPSERQLERVSLAQVRTPEGVFRYELTSQGGTFIRDDGIDRQTAGDQCGPGFATPVMLLNLSTDLSSAVPGYLFEPQGAQTTGGAGPVAWLHGGPARHTDPTAPDLMIESLVARGFPTLSVDYPGSDNYGRWYERALDQNPMAAAEVSIGGAEKWVATEQGRALGAVIGISYGAYLGALALTAESETDVFVFIAGIYTPSALSSEVQNAPEFKRIFTAVDGSIVAPVPRPGRSLVGKKVMIVHAEGDRRSSIRDAEAYAETLRRAGADVTFRRISGQDHLMTLVSEEDREAVLSFVQTSTAASAKPQMP